MAIGYIELDDWVPFRKLFAYMDAPNHYCADELLRKYKLKIKFKNEWSSADDHYRMIFCSVPKKQAHLFIKAMTEMPMRMQSLGYEDYIEYWSKTMAPLLDENEVLSSQP